MTFDQIRDLHPHLALAVYAYDPGGEVTVEVISPDGTRFQASGLTLDSILQSLFPDPVVEELPTSRPVDLLDGRPRKPEPSIFD